jgi:hypothetical protein
MERDPKDVVHDLLEHYIRHLPIDQKLDYLARFVRAGNVERIDEERGPEFLSPLRDALEKAVPRLTREDAESVVRRLLREFIQGEINRRVAQRETEPAYSARMERRPPARDNSRGPFKLVIADHGEPLSATEFSEFLTLFSKVYDLAIDLPQDDNILALAESSSLVREHYLNALREKLKSEFETQQKDHPLIIERIRKTSPVTIWFEALATALILAVIVSGGTVKFPGFTCRVNALGDGLKKLKAFFYNERTLAKGTTKKKRKNLRAPDGD